MDNPFSKLETQSECQNAIGQRTARRARLSRIRNYAGSWIEQNLRVQSVVLGVVENVVRLNQDAETATLAQTDGYKLSHGHVEIAYARISQDSSAAALVPQYRSCGRCSSERRQRERRRIEE